MVAGRQEQVANTSQNSEQSHRSSIMYARDTVAVAWLQYNIMYRDTVAVAWLQYNIMYRDNVAVAWLQYNIMYRDTVAVAWLW